MRARVALTCALLVLAGCTAGGQPNGLGTPAATPQPTTQTAEPS
jgi:hypothetical protein